MVSVRAETAPKVPTIRRAQPADAEVCGRICYEAFTTLNNEVQFSAGFSVARSGAGCPVLHVRQSRIFLCRRRGGRKTFWAVTAWMSARAIAGIGPITVDPAVQNKTVGRQLMMAVMDRAAERQFAGVRLVQAAFHSRSMALYAKLGFDIREPLVVMQGPAIRRSTQRICSASRCCRAMCRPATPSASAFMATTAPVN